MNLPVFIAAWLLFAASLCASTEVQDLNTPRQFPELRSRADWEHRAEQIREQVLVSCGLWPMPPKTSLNPKIFDRIERDGYSVEKVYIETFPGFFLAGNLYRPLGKPGPFPAVLNPHGHWANGRLQESELGSMAARCINFALQGMVAFSYDMVGYNDTRQVDHKFASHPTNQLWNISLMGLQTWNSIRALDFLESLPDVDRTKIACTGESGGGTQTFMLGALDRRLAAQAPVVMVSHSMQGGCLCENAPGLRVDYSNMEIAAAAAPRPQILVAATGDWTRKTLEVEGPAIEGVYRLFNAENKFDYAIFDYPHNYNKASREAVYTWFNRWLLNSDAKVQERAYKKEPDEQLRVFPSALPENAIKGEELIPRMIAIYRRQLAELLPQDSTTLHAWKTRMHPLWKHSLQLALVQAGPDRTQEIHAGADQRIELIDLQVGPVGKAKLIHCEPKRPKAGVIVISATAEERDGEELHLEWPEEFVKRNYRVLNVLVEETDTQPTDYSKGYYTTYNRTPVQRAVGAIQAACEYARRRFPGDKLVLYGTDSASGIACVFSAPLADGVIANVAGVDETKAERLMEDSVFFPGYRRIGGVQGILALAAPNPVLLMDVSEAVDLSWLTPLYKQLKQVDNFQAEKNSIGEKRALAWLQRHFPR